MTFNSLYYYYYYCSLAVEVTGLKVRKGLGERVVRNQELIVKKDKKNERGFNSKMK